jgi:tetratricopeptide (TPR) repeat protein
VKPGPLLLAASIVLGGCAPDHGLLYERAMTDADQAEVSGRYAESAAGFDAAARLARIRRDQTHATYLAALMFERAGDLPSARARFEALSSTLPPAEDSGAAAYKEAAMDIEAGDEARGWAEMKAMLLRFPNDGTAKSAMHRILTHIDETEGPSASAAYLRTIEPSLTQTERAEEVGYETALRILSAGKLEEARDALVRVAARWRYPVGALWDDALYKAAEIDERLGRPEAALADLDAMLSQQEVSILNGSYTRPRFPEAQMLAAKICRDDLHDTARARQLFHAAYARFPDWGERDRALWQEAELWKKEVRTAEECGTLATLVHEIPDSRYVPCATERCPTLSRPAGSHAPSECHAYIERPGP